MFSSCAILSIGSNGIERRRTWRWEAALLDIGRKMEVIYCTWKLGRKATAVGFSRIDVGGGERNPARTLLE